MCMFSLTCLHTKIDSVYTIRVLFYCCSSLPNLPQKSLHCCLQKFSFHFFLYLHGSYLCIYHLHSYVPELECYQPIFYSTKKIPKCLILMHLHIVGTVTKQKFIKSESQVNDCFSDFSHSFPIAVETFDTSRNSGRDFFVFLSNVLSSFILF